MKRNKIKIIYSTHLGIDRINRFNEHIEKTIGCDHEIFPFENYNEFSLTEIYNKGLKKYNDNESILIFCHHDIKFRTNNWGRQILTKFNSLNYQILGLAGTSNLSENCVWWTNKEDLYGVVDHTDGYKIWTSEFSKPFNGVKDVIVIDGLFMAVDCNNIENLFDENIKGFHMYDVDFCLNNYLDGCNIGVVSDIRVLHESIGEVDKEWDSNRKQLIEKFKHELPIKI